VRPAHATARAASQAARLPGTPSRGRILPVHRHDYRRVQSYVIDHVVPLRRGGADSPGNMQWQTTAAAKAKDRVE